MDNCKQRWTLPRLSNKQPKDDQNITTLLHRKQIDEQEKSSDQGNSAEFSRPLPDKSLKEYKVAIKQDNVQRGRSKTKAGGVKKDDIKIKRTKETKLVIDDQIILDATSEETVEIKNHETETHTHDEKYNIDDTNLLTPYPIPRELRGRVSKSPSRILKRADCSPKNIEMIGPSFEIPLESINNVKLGSNPVIHSKISGHPQPVVTWFFNGSELIPSPDSSHSYENGNAVLKISNFRKEDVGLYALKAHNKVGLATCFAALCLAEGLPHVMLAFNTLYIYVFICIYSCFVY